MKTKSGKIIPNGVRPEPHELDTILFFTELGKEVELIPISHTPKVKSPDFIMEGQYWEMKSPTSCQPRTLERLFYSASTQSSNIIIDLRRLKKDSVIATRTLEKCFKNTRRVRKLYIITKENELKVYAKS